MKVNIVTMNGSYNYGAMLQAYALQETIKCLGHEPEFIDQRKQEKKHVDFYRSLKKIPANLYTILHRRKVELGYRRFEEFLSEFQNVTDINYGSYNDLINKPPKADIYLSGSDQVWNPISLKPINFLAFAQNIDAPKVSYAASLGVDKIEKAKHDKYASYLKHFKHLSVREESAKKILERITDRNVHVHIDPVFLLGEEKWEKLARPIKGIDEPYILCYIMYRPKWLNKWLRNLKKKTKKKIVLVYNTSYRNIYHDHMVRDAGPREFLHLFINADEVITSSFHGMAYAILFNKPFYTVVNPNAISRFDNLVRLFGLEDNILTEGMDHRIPQADYAGVNDIISRERLRAKNYLKDALKS